MATARLDHGDQDFLLQFNKALNAASVWQLNQIIRDICRRLLAATSIVSDALLVTEDQVAVERDDDDLDSDSDSNSELDSELDSDDAGRKLKQAWEQKQEQEQEHEREPANGILEVVAPAVPLPASRKRYRPRWATCGNCEDDYDVTDNFEEACYYRPEPPEPDEDAWQDHNEWMNEDVNTKYWRELYPDKFYHTCCERRYGDDGCKIGWHEEETGLKRRKYF